nr:MAG TPA: hypothetical protein [Caudoviricetes sp.]DAQ99328.1 MAG TPA: hypothetical protein [Caudoviricetes sp.]
MWSCSWITRRRKRLSADKKQKPSDLHRPDGFCSIFEYVIYIQQLNSMIIKITTQQNGIRENHFGRIGLSHLNVTYVIIMTN